METILGKLIHPDNISINEGTNELREAFKNANAIPELCACIGSSSSPEIRQLAAVILRKKLSKHRYWLKLSVETRQYVKQGLMQALVAEQEKAVKTAVAQVIGVLLRHEMPESSWPELMQFIQQMTLSQNVQDKEIGFFALHILTDMSADHFLTHAQSFAKLFSDTLSSLTDPASTLAYLTVLCMTNFVMAIEGDQVMVNAYHNMVPSVVGVVKALATRRPDRAVEALNLIDELTDEAITVIVPHLKLLIESCLELCQDAACGDDLQVKALNIVGMLVQTKKKQIVKLKLVEPILSVLFRLMCTAPEDGDNEEYFPDEDECSTPATVANQTLDTLALHLPPEKILLPLMEQYVVPNLSSSEPRQRKAAYLAMAVVAEGCADYIRHRHVQTLVGYLMTGLQDPAPVVSNAALFAVGQFSEHLQPNISVHASELVPFLLEHLKNVSKKEEESQKMERMFYALESFCENLNDGVLPFLPMLMNYLLPLLSPPYPVRLRELAISAVGACGNAAKEAMMPYFQGVMESLKVYLTQVQGPDTMCLQVQSIDTLGILARTIGNDNFLPMAKESMEVGLQLMSKADDPDLQKATYGLFASVATVLKDDMAPYLTPIMEAIIQSVTSDKGVVVHQKDDGHPTVGLFDNESDTEAEEDLGNTSDVSNDEDNTSVDGVTVENAYLEEKEEAVIAIRDLAQNCMNVFLPYIEKCYEEVFKLVNYPHDDIRSAAVTTLTQLCVNLHKANITALTNVLHMLVPKLAEIVRTDRERDVVITGLDSFQELLKEVGAPVLAAEGHTDAIINCIKDILTQRTECQDGGEDEEGVEAEGDEVLIESAGELVPMLGKVMPANEFAQHYPQFLSLFCSLMKKNSSDSQRSFGVGMVAECMISVGPNLSVYVGELMPLLTQLARDQNDEVRNNAIYALGELVFHGKECTFPYYGEILQTLSSAVMTEKSSGVLDNICGALARLIMTNVSIIPLDQVVPVFIRYLPLREDFEENKWVYHSLSVLYKMGSQPLLQNITPVIKACAISLHEKQIETEHQSIIINLLKSCQRNFPSEVSRAASELPEPVATTLHHASQS